MFLGQYLYPIDEKKTIPVPDHFLASIGDGAFVTQGFDRNVMVLTEQAFSELYQRIISMNIADPVARMLLRLFLGNAAKVEVDAAGRFQLPEKLASFVQLDREVMLIGQGEYFEIWAPDQWNQQATQLQNVEQNAQRFTALDLAVR